MAPGGPRFGVLLAVIAGFVAAGVPLVAVAWHNVNHLLAGDVGEIRLLVSASAVTGLGVVLYGLARVVNSLGGHGPRNPGTQSPPT